MIAFTIPRLSIPKLLLALALALSTLAATPEAKARPASNKGFFGHARRALRAAKAAGIGRAERRRLGRSLLRTLSVAPRGDRRDLRAVLAAPSLKVAKGGPDALQLVGPRHVATLAGGKLTLKSTTLTWQGREEWGTRAGRFTKLRSGSFSYDQPGVSARDTRTGEAVKLTYRVFGQVMDDRKSATRIIIFDPTVEPVGRSHTYRYKPGARAMKSLLSSVGRELGRLFPEAKTMVLQRWRDTAGYARGGGGQRVSKPKSVDKQVEYDLALFR